MVSNDFNVGIIGFRPSIILMFFVIPVLYKLCIPSIEI